MSYCNKHINIFLTMQTKPTSGCLLLPCHIVHVRPLSQWNRWTMCEVGIVQNVHFWPFKPWAKKPQSLDHNNHSDNHFRNSKDICLRPWLLPLKCALIASALDLSNGQIFLLMRWRWSFFSKLCDTDVFRHILMYRSSLISIISASLQLHHFEHFNQIHFDW